MTFRSLSIFFVSLTLLTTIIFLGDEVYAQFASSTPITSAEATSTPPVSTVFNIGDYVYPSEEVSVRASAGIDGKFLGFQASGTSAIIVNDPVRADDLIWWNLDYASGVDGWSAEEYFKRATLVPATVRASFSPAGENKITNLVSSRSNIGISGSRIIWQENRSGDSDIYVYDLNTRTEQQLTTSGYSETQPSISGDKVVYLRRQIDLNNPGYDTTVVYLFDLGARFERPLTPGATFQSSPVVSGNYVAYVETNNNDRVLYLYNLSTNDKEVVARGTSIAQPQLAGNYLVWTDEASGSGHVSVYDIQKKAIQRVTNHTIEQINPAVSASGKVIFAGRRSGGIDDWHVFLYDIGSGAEHYLTTHSGTKPTDLVVSDIYGSWSQDGEIFVHNLSSGTQTQLTQLSGFRKEVSIDGANIAWIDGRSENGEDLYFWNIK